MKIAQLGDTYGLLTPAAGSRHCLWVIAGVHGEEPAPLAAVADRAYEIVAGEWASVIIPMANPTGVVMRERLGSRGARGGWEFTNDLYSLIQAMPPTIVLDLHEDSAFDEGAYLYHLGPNDWLPSVIIERWKRAGVPVAEEGRPRFLDQEIYRGLAFYQGDDGSIDDMFYRATGCDVITAETPTYWDPDYRIGAHVLAIDAIMRVLRKGANAKHS